MDKRLNFIEHAKYVKEKVKKVCAKLKRIANSYWGIKTTHLKLIYNVVITSIMTYGAEAWYNSIEHSHVKRNIESAQRFALLTILKACRTVSTPALQVIAGCLPIDLLIKIRGINYTLKTKKIIVSDIYETPINIIEMTDKEIIQERKKIKKLANAKWQERWETESRGRMTFKFVPKADFATKNNWFHPGRNCTYLITEHGPFNKKLHEFNLSETPYCGFCITGKKEESLQHILFECNKYETIRENSTLNKKLEQAHNTQTYDILIENQETYTEFNKLAEEILKYRKENLKK